MQTLSFKAWAPECLTQLSKIPVLKHLGKGTLNFSLRILATCIHSCMTTSTPLGRGAGCLAAQRMDNTVSSCLHTPDRGSFAFSGPTATKLLLFIRLCCCKDLNTATPLLVKLWSLCCLQMVYAPQSLAEMSTQTQTQTHAHTHTVLHAHNNAHAHTQAGHASTFIDN